MDTLDYYEYKFDFSNFKMFIDKFKELANMPYDTVDECLVLLKELLLFQHEVLRISKGACIDYELNDSIENKDHVQLTFNMFNRIFGLRERIFNKLVLNYSEEEVINRCDKELTNYIKKIYYPKEHTIDVNNPEYVTLIRNIDILWSKARFENLDLPTLKQNTIMYINLNKKMLNMVGFKYPLDRELFLDGINKDIFIELCKYNFSEYKSGESIGKVKLKDALGIYNEVFNKYYDEEVVNIFEKLLSSNSIRYVVEDENKKFKVGTYASYSNIPKILTNYNGSMEALYGFIFELGHAFVLDKQNNNRIFDYEYNVFVGNIIGYVNELLLYKTLKDNNSPLLSDSNIYLANMLSRANDNLKALKVACDAYYSDTLSDNKDELMYVYNDFAEYREVLGIVIAGYITKKLINNEIDKDKYSKFIGMSGNIMIKDILNSIDINIDDISIIKEGIDFLKEFVK